jgi:peptidoglycan L-alanyl-D-glutamate endopeptidase CwlK
MIIFLPLILAYALAIGIAGWFVLHADKKKQLLQLVAGLFSRVTLRVDSGLSTVSGNTNRIRSGIRGAGTLLLQTGVRHKKALGISFVILTMPIILAILLKSNRALDGYADVPQTTDPVISALLQGEQLVPPAPLPPEMFATREVEAVRQDLSGASREWAMLDSDFRQRLLTVFQLMAKRGYQMALIEGYRSPERQNYLAGLGSQVTNVGAYQSYHQYGLAADCAFLHDGKLVISEKDPWAMAGYRLYGEYAQMVGLNWGGRWRLMDFGHTEFRKAQILGRH